MNLRISGRYPAVSLTALIGAAGLVALAQSRGADPAAAKIETRAAEASATDLRVAPRRARKPLAYYVSGVNRALFSAPAPSAPKLVIAARGAPSPATMPLVVNPYADYAYTGTVTIGGALMALIENVKTKEGLYLKEGDHLVAGTITRITDRLVTIDAAGQTQMLAKRDDFKLVPLDKSAGFLQTPGAQPGSPPASGGGPPGGGPPGKMMRGGPPGGMSGKALRIRPQTAPITPEAAGVQAGVQMPTLTEATVVEVHRGE